MPDSILKIFRHLWVFFLVTLLIPAAGDSEEYIQLAGVVHLHTTFSSGAYSLEELVEKAKEKGIEVLIPTDHDLVAMEYGLFPLRNIIKKRVERKSILKEGPERYLLDISQINKAQKNVLVIPGAQSSPFYYWTGSPFMKNLTAHDYRKELLLIGMKNPEDYQHLPILHNGFSTQYLKAFLPQAIVLSCAFSLALFLIIQRGVIRYIGIFVALSSLLLLIDHHPFKSSRFDPYHGEQGIGPFQELIDYVRDRKGLVFWAHPESKYAQDGVRIGPVTLKTPPYPDALLESARYTGFAAIYGDMSHLVDPGKQWDQALNQFCGDKRERPPWAISESDFHTESEDVGLDTFQTIFLVGEKSIAGVLESLAKGRMYALQKGKEPRMVLDRFEVEDKDAKRSAGMGSGIRLQRSPLVTGRLSSSGAGRLAVDVSLIRGGTIFKRFKGETPLEFSFEDPDGWTGKTYYRLDVQDSSGGRLITNPIFVSGGPQRSSN
jgi:hypothetical protein